MTPMIQTLLAVLAVLTALTIFVVRHSEVEPNLEKKDDK